jgi:hypothetical protein
VEPKESVQVNRSQAGCGSTIIGPGMASEGRIRVAHRHAATIFNDRPRRVKTPTRARRAARASPD